MVIQKKRLGGSPLSIVQAVLCTFLGTPGTEISKLLKSDLRCYHIRLSLDPFTKFEVGVGGRSQTGIFIPELIQYLLLDFQIFLLVIPKLECL